jgi:hypothetical protein
MSDRVSKAIKARMDELKKAAGGVQYQAGYAPPKEAAAVTNTAKP